MSQSQVQPLPPSKMSPSQYTVVLPNLSYPSRSHSDISWSRSLDPLRFARNMNVRSPPTLAFTYASATATTASNTVTTDEDNTDLCSVTHAFRGIRGLIWHEILIFASNLKLLVQKAITTSPTPIDSSS